MIIQADAKALEWVCGTFLSKDEVAFKEIWDKVDQHTHNQNAFGLPSRLIAKKFVFRLMYGGGAWSYAHDPDFSPTSSSSKFWQRVIDAFYEKYFGFKEWHTVIVQKAMLDGHLIMPTGRIYEFDYKRNHKGELVAPDTLIKNYPVQGFGADIMSIIRVSFMKRFMNANIDGKLINTVHDSIVVDCNPRHAEEVAALFHAVFADLPANYQRLFGHAFTLPMTCEVLMGNNLKELHEYEG